MQKILLSLVVYSLCSTSYGIRGIYVGATGGQVSFISGAADTQPSIGFGIQSAIRYNKIVDFMVTVMDSAHNGNQSLNNLFAGVSAEFHPMLLDSLEVTMGLGTGINLLANGSTSETRPNANFGAAVDLIIGKPYRLGFVGRAYFLGGGNLGGNVQTILLRFGYVFDMMS